MAEVFYISPKHTYALPHAIHAVKTRHLTALAPLLKTLFQRGINEEDIHHATVVVLHAQGPGLPSGEATENEKGSENLSAFTELDTLSFDEKVLLLRYFFSHLNLIVVSTDDVANAGSVRELNSAIDKIETLVKNRISRVATWTGTGININDAYSRQEPITGGERIRISEIVATMSFLVYHHANISRATQQQIVALKDMMLRCIDFRLLLHDHTDTRLRMLCHIVGHWSFPAHELTNDDLVYCVFLMLGFAINHVKSFAVPGGLEFPSPNELFALVFMVRDSYKNGNSFHNFRHAVDVLQACFHFLIRLKCLPEFEQLETDPRGSEAPFLRGESATVPCTELVAVSETECVREAKTENDSADSADSSGAPAPLVSPLQCLGLLVAALGHDVGHPGVTNAFMIKCSSPTSQLFGERSVLELYHASVFVNKILSINWPSLLKVETSSQARQSLSLKHLIINSILATDMAEHFEYISKLKTLDLNLAQQSNDRVKLICSLLIKCADISNVTRPLRVSSQWAQVLSQEFLEVEILERAIDRNSTEFEDVDYPTVPSEIDEILKVYPNIHKGQIFFIQTFAEGLFNSIEKHFPELKYTSEIIEENNQFWLKRVEDLKDES